MRRFQTSHALSQELEHERPPRPAERLKNGSAAAEWPTCCKRHAMRYHDVPADDLARIPDVCGEAAAFDLRGALQDSLIGWDANGSPVE